MWMALLRSFYSIFIVLRSGIWLGNSKWCILCHSIVDFRSLSCCITQQRKSWRHFHPTSLLGWCCERTMVETLCVFYICVSVIAIVAPIHNLKNKANHDYICQKYVVNVRHLGTVHTVGHPCFRNAFELGVQGPNWKITCWSIHFSNILAGKKNAWPVVFFIYQPPVSQKVNGPGIICLCFEVVNCVFTWHLRHVKPVL